MLTVYGRNNSINVQKVMWTLGELDLAVDRKDVGGAFGQNNESWYLDLNPNGLIPVLDDGGSVHWESNVCVRYLAAKYDAGGLWPEDPVARSLSERWMDWMLGVLHPVMTPVFWGLIRTAEADRDMAAIRAHGETLCDLYAMLDKQLADKPFIAGDHLTIGDIPIGCAAYRWYGLDVPHPELPNLRRCYELLAARPAFQEHVMIAIT
jgi:glutathione S-transferase